MTQSIRVSVHVGKRKAKPKKPRLGILSSGSSDKFTCTPPNCLVNGTCTGAVSGTCTIYPIGHPELALCAIIVITPGAGGNPDTWTAAFACGSLQGGSYTVILTLYDAQENIDVFSDTVVYSVRKRGH